MKITNELRQKLLAAKSEKEVDELLKEVGVDGLSAEQVWAELTKKREADGKELSLDELEVVSGGTGRDWLSDGCAATVEPGSTCFFSTDNCDNAIWYSYSHEPGDHQCLACGSYPLYESDKISLENIIYLCKNCGGMHLYNHFDGLRLITGPKIGGNVF